MEGRLFACRQREPRVFVSVILARNSRRLLELDIRRGVANAEFELHYQPQVDAQTETIAGCEALLRWNHPTRGIAPPSQFIPVAEEIGVIVSLGAWVIQQACRDAATWPERIGAAVNLSSAQFSGLTLAQTVTSALEASGLSPLRLELERARSLRSTICAPWACGSRWTISAPATRH